MRRTRCALALALAFVLGPTLGYGQSSESRGQSSESRGQSSESRGQSSESRGQSSESRGQAPEQKPRGRGSVTAEFTLGTYLRAVASGSLELAAQRANVSIAQAQIAIAKAFPEPDVTAGLLQYDLSRQGNPTSSIVSMGVPIELGGKRGARVAVAEGGVSASRDDLDDFVRTLRARAANSYLDALHARLVLERKRKTLASLERLVRVNEQRLSAGDIGEALLVQSRVEGEQFRSEVLAAESAVRSADLAMVELMGSGAAPFARQTLHLEGDLEKTGDREFDVESLVRFAVSHRPDLSSAQRRVAIASRQIDLARANHVPDVTLAASWQHNFSLGGVSPLPASDFVGGTITVPLPLSRAFYRGDIEAAQATRTQAEAAVKAVALRVEIEVRQAVDEYEKAAARVGLYQQGVLLDAEKVLEKTLYNYQHGGATLVEVLVAQRTVDAVYLGYFDALADSAHALVAVEQATTLWDVRL